MMKRIAMVLIGLLPVSAGIAADQPNEIQQAGPNWHAPNALAAPALPTATPGVSAGCVVIGHHILPDGSTARPRILKGAFTANVDDAVRKAFSESALVAAKSWRFAAVDPAKARGEFHLEAVGFGPASGDAPRVVIGIQQQQERLRNVCEIADLAAWGEQNAIPTEQAQARNGDKVIVRKAGDVPATYWVASGDRAIPVYPRQALLADAQACVVVGFTIRADGTVDGLKIMSGDFSNTQRPLRQAFENNAAAAVATWRFAPGPDNLGRMPVFEQTPITFELDGQRWKADRCDATSVAALVQAASP